MRDVYSIFFEGKDALPLEDNKRNLFTMAELERAIIKNAMLRLHMADAARALGIGRSTLYRKVREYGLEEFNQNAK